MSQRLAEHAMESSSLGQRVYSSNSIATSHTAVTIH